MPDERNELGVDPFGFTFDDQPETDRPTAAEIRRRVAENRARERAAQILDDGWIDRLQEALVPYRGMDRLGSLTREPLVYFVQPENGGPVKIGSALDYALRRRVIDLQIANHEQLVVRRLVHGGVTVEKLLHAEFRDLRIRGEWFRDEGKLADLIRPNGVLRVVMRSC